MNVEFARRVDVRGRGEAWLAPGDGAICLISTDPRQGLPDGFTIKCKPTAQVATGALYSTWIAGENPETGRTIVLGVVPDGVRTVLVTDDDGSRRLVPARQNVYSVWGGRARWVEFDTPSGRRRTRV